MREFFVFWPDPRRGLKINSPEMRSRCQELHAYANALAPTVSQVHNPAFLFFLGFGIHQYQHLPVVHFMPQVQQPAMRANHQSFAHLAKLPPLMAAPQGLQPHLVEHALAASLRALSEFSHALIFASPP